ncbi:uncharacterized protein Z520_05640 [Fonsecaea multimorphosa CBS 102226]|uniref:F-box domain-containing protein n=1 Tax=Fonsecaea multimorphosa CBS 102226 TaxID=1442371 RepID=A0A0D2K5C3_9EURO|nr:uncharacterized protein Z520_05640 [Fonsecaea multimorphosa CBS 102226]KIX98339.1 hypothetical protein Z520_05640 [Fonsecaea multimorphosa CBS 102226]OAL24534.1 hypothetical protein AYO22_05323 [Fonsecaea multimorphosa]
MLNKIPLEILEHILSSLEREDLQAVRLVNWALSSKVGPALFRTLYVSCLTLDRLQHIARHPTLCLAVEELRYQELNFDLIVDEERSWEVLDGPTWRDERMDYLEITICQFITALQSDREHLLGDSRASDLTDDEGDTTMVDAEQWKPDRREVRAMVVAVKELYAEKARLQSPLHLYGVFREALPRLLNLRRVVCVEAEAGCIAMDSARIERTGAFDRLRNVLPLSDHHLRSTLQRDTLAWPSHGFMGIWRALSDQDSNPGIRHLEVRRNSDLFLKHGIHLNAPDLDSHGPALVHGFRNLMVLSLCLEVNARASSDMVPNAAILSEALRHATNLRRLEICLTSCAAMPPHSWMVLRSHRGVPFGDAAVRQPNILPFVSFPDLHTVVFEEADFTSDQICAWLFMQPKLRHLTLRRPYLQGRWQNVIQRWSDAPEFVLDSFELLSPWDYDNRDLEENPPHPDMVQVPSRVRSDALLEFINRGGELNPFEVRTWRPFHAAGERENDAANDETETDENDETGESEETEETGESEETEETGENDDDDDAQDEEDNLSEYSDLSEWVPEDHPTPVEDPDGPEFDEDYDFDAEPDSDIELEGGPSGLRQEEVMQDLAYIVYGY